MRRSVSDSTCHSALFSLVRAPPTAVLLSGILAKLRLTPSLAVTLVASLASRGCAGLFVHGGFGCGVHAGVPAAACWTPLCKSGGGAAAPMRPQLNTPLTVPSACVSGAQVALYSAREIAPGEELFAHYGTAYEPLRDYSVGEAAVVRKRDIPATQYPAGLAAQGLRVPPEAYQYV